MEAKKYYIAYGSNLSRQQMAQRCPGAKIVGGAVLKGWQLLFGYYATVEPSRGQKHAGAGLGDHLCAGTAVG